MDFIHHLGLACTGPSANVAPNFFRSCEEAENRRSESTQDTELLIGSPPVILVRLKQDDVELGEELEGKGDIGREGETDAGGNHLENTKSSENW